MSGQAFLRVRLDGASGTDPTTGIATYRGPTRVAGAGGPQVTEVVRTGDFEGTVTWVIGLHARAPFTVQTLENPSRLVVDVQTAG